MGDTRHGLQSRLQESRLPATPLQESPLQESRLQVRRPSNVEADDLHQEIARLKELVVRLSAIIVRGVTVGK